MARFLAVLLLFFLPAWAANLKLYLKDGDYHLVREYKVEQDRVRFYSVERSQWEEIPLELVDLKRTEQEAAQRKAQLAEEARILSEEDHAEREKASELSKIPVDSGVYQVVDGKLRIFKLAESKVRTRKGRSILKAVAPIPIVAGKGTLELEGERSAYFVDTDRPEFYIVLATPERFGIFKLTPAKGVRIVEKLTFVPVSREIVEEPEAVEVFRQQLADDVYKIWPQQPLAPGEYAVVEYTEGKLNIQIWDFAYYPDRKWVPPAPAPEAVKPPQARK
jgi:hypothetical protein